MITLISLIIGVFISLPGVLILFFARSISKSHFITIPAGFGGKSFAEKFGEKRGSQYMKYFGLIFIIFGAIVSLQG